MSGAHEKKSMLGKCLGIIGLGDKLSKEMDEVTQMNLEGSGEGQN